MSQVQHMTKGILLASLMYFSLICNVSAMDAKISLIVEGNVSTGADLRVRCAIRDEIENCLLDTGEPEVVVWKKTPPPKAYGSPDTEKISYFGHRIPCYEKSINFITIGHKDFVIDYYLICYEALQEDITVGLRPFIEDDLVLDFDQKKLAFSCSEDKKYIYIERIPDKLHLMATISRNEEYFDVLFDTGTTLSLFSTSMSKTFVKRYLSYFAGSDSKGTVDKLQAAELSHFKVEGHDVSGGYGIIDVDRGYFSYLSEDIEGILGLNHISKFNWCIKQESWTEKW